jgi:hypothetical protein
MAFRGGCPDEGQAGNPEDVPMMVNILAGEDASFVNGHS